MYLIYTEKIFALNVKFFYDKDEMIKKQPSLSIRELFFSEYVIVQDSKFEERFKLPGSSRKA